MDSLMGSLLVATPTLVDPNFARTVVLVLQHDDEGCVGVVLNRPTEEQVSDHLPTWAPLVPAPGTVYAGGPVEPEVAIGLTLSPDGLPTGVPGLTLADLGGPPPGEASPTRVYSGYAGWGSGQLEEEISTGAWYIVQASPDDPFDDDRAQWRKVLRRQPGPLAIVSTFPEDPGLN